MESGSVLSEATRLTRGFSAERSSSMTVLSPQAFSGKPRMSQLETLEAKMASIEVSLSSATPRRRKGGSLGGSISSRSSSKPEAVSAPPPRELRSALQDREAVIQNLRLQLGLGKLPRPSGTPIEDADRPVAEQRLARLKIDAENKRIAIRNLKSALEKLDITDNIDVRIRQAELEYALGREELQLLSLVEESRALQGRLDKSRPEANTLFCSLQSGVTLSLHAVQANAGRWAVIAKSNCPGIWVEWALDGEGLYRGDRIIEVNGKLVASTTRDDFQTEMGTGGKCQLVVVRKRAVPFAQQQLIQSQEDNMRLQHRISYLEDQVKELQTSREPSPLPPPVPPQPKIVSQTLPPAPTKSTAAHCTTNGLTNGHSGGGGGGVGTHVTSISISSSTQNPSGLPPTERPQIFQRGNFITTIIGGKPVHNPPPPPTLMQKSLQHSQPNQQNQLQHHQNVTKTLIKEGRMSSHLHSQSQSQLQSQAQAQHLENQRHNTKNHHHHHTTHHQNGIDKRSEANNNNGYNGSHLISASTISLHSDVSHAHHHNHRRERRRDYSHPHSQHYDQPRRHHADIRSVKSLDFESDCNERRNGNGSCGVETDIDYTSEPVAARIRPMPPKKPLRLSLQRAQSLQTVEAATILELDRKRAMKRTYRGDKMHDASHYIENNLPMLLTTAHGRGK